MTQTLANFMLAWLCVLQPGIAFAFGLLIGRHGFKHGITLVLIKIFGQPASGVEGSQ